MNHNSSFKNALKKFVPPPTNVFNREIKQVLDTLDSSKHNDILISEIKQLNLKLDECTHHLNEITWANIFNSTISDSKWLDNLSFSPGRAAIGYPFLYVLYRVLNEIHPTNILELGLGQSTKMIGQYATFNKATHYIVEHDPMWVKFFKRANSLSDYTKIVLLNTILEPYGNSEPVRVYEGFEQHFKGIKYDLFCIDAPFGYDMPRYARIDVLKILPYSLKESFVIMVDDYQRIGEKNMTKEVQRILESNSINFSTGVYSGDKDVCLICSADLSFLCTL